MLVTAFAAVLLLVFLAMPAFPLLLSSPQLLRNGAFEDGFSPTGVAAGWSAFDSGGGRWYIWEDAGRLGRAWQGKGAQGIRLLPAEEAYLGETQFAGICQAVSMRAGQVYIFGLRGRLTALSAQRYDAPVRAQWGTAWGEGTAWREVTAWHDIPWPAVSAEAEDPLWLSLETSFVAEADAGLLCIRLWRRREFSSMPAGLYMDNAYLRAWVPDILDDERAVTVQVALGVPSFVLAGALTPLHVTVSGDGDIQAIVVYADDRIIAVLDNYSEPMPQEASVFWRPEAPGRHLLRAEVWAAGGRAAWTAQEVLVGEPAEFLSGDWYTQEEHGGVSWEIPVRGLWRGASYALYLAVRVTVEPPASPPEAPCLVRYRWSWQGDFLGHDVPMWRRMNLSPSSDDGQEKAWRAVVKETIVAGSRDAVLAVHAVPWHENDPACRLVLETASLRGYR
ncbi:MAG: hypothetical protein ACUVWB_06385 [Anaerolineae bacterium]